MKFLEKDLEEIIFKAKKQDLKQKGLNVKGKVYRQLRIGNYGVADLVTFEREFCREWGAHNLVITVYELKKDKIGISTFLQALGYLKGIKRYLSDRYPSYHLCYKIVLIGKIIDISSTFVYLSDFYDDLENYTYDYGINGIEFKKQKGYKLTNENFKK